MLRSVKKYLDLEYPRSFLIRKPVTGGLIVATYCFIFIILYHPLNTHPGRFTGYYTTMAIYSLFTGLATFFSVLMLRSFKWFSAEQWNLKKELVTISIITGIIGFVIYFMGFILQEPHERWNIPTLVSSLYYAVLLSITPFLFVTASNYRYLFHKEYHQTNEPVLSNIPNVQTENAIRISSQLKKESLSFLPGELIYAESEGNYVVFYLWQNNRLKREMIRNSINNIEQQLSSIPHYFRTHRAFIVNLKKVTGRNGTSLGYTLRMEGTDAKVPVSRNNTRKFNTVFASSKQ